MYQYSQIAIQNGFTKMDFDKLYKAFMSEICNISMEEDNREYDMDADYIINWACIWNSPDDIGKTVKMIQKNNKIAFAAPENFLIKGGNILRFIFRIEDLTRI